MAEYVLKENTMNSWDGASIFYRSWLPETPYKNAVVLFHRGHEHSGRLLKVVEKLNLPEDYAYFAWDARGNGKSSGERDSADNFGVYIKDADTFVSYLAKNYNIEINNMSVIANSIGAVIACAWVHDYAPPIRSLTMATPAFRIKLYVPFGIVLLRLAQKLGMMKMVKSYVKSVVLTHDREEQKTFNNDPLITHSIATNILLDAYDTATRLIKDAGAITIPVQMHAAGSDWVVKNSPQKKFFDNLGSQVKDWNVYPKQFHALFNEKNNDLIIVKTRDFINYCFSQDIKPVTLVNSDRYGHTKREFDKLSLPSKNPIFAISKFGLKRMGGLSEGINVGIKNGFDSGVMLDYVYKNQPTGSNNFGNFVDKNYLNSIGWKGIRQRKVNMEKTLRHTIENLHANEQPVKIVDIASGPGRYILDVIGSIKDIPITALLRDYRQVNLDEGVAIAKEMKLDQVQFQQGDAFNKQQLSELNLEPTLAIASGLYELFPDNQSIMNSLDGLSNSVKSGGYLIYTNQPWHPQLEFIARVLPNRLDEPWVMRRRTQAEMDELVHHAGFKKINMEIDQWGIFSVSLAQKI